MTKYKGYYIDNIYFFNKSEIDEFIKQQAIKRFKTLVKIFVNHMSMEASIACSEQADYLHNNFGISYEEIEQIEISVYAA